MIDGEYGYWYYAYGGKLCFDCWALPELKATVSCAAWNEL